MVLRRVFQLLLCLYPTEYRRLFAAEMLAVLEERAGERRGNRWALAEIAALLAGAGAEWASRLRDGDDYLSNDSEAADDAVETRKLIQLTVNCMDYAIAHHDFVRARFYSAVHDKLGEKLRRLLETRGEHTEMP